MDLKKIIEPFSDMKKVYVSFTIDSNIWDELEEKYPAVFSEYHEYHHYRAFFRNSFTELYNKLLNIRNIHHDRKDDRSFSLSINFSLPLSNNCT